MIFQHVLKRKNKEIIKDMDQIFKKRIYHLDPVNIKQILNHLK